MPVVLDAHDLQRQHVALLDHLLRMANAPLHQLRDMYQALHRARQAREGAERHQLRDHRRHDVAHGVLGDQLFPLLGRRAPNGECDLLALAVHLHHVDLDGVAGLEQLLRVDVAVPRDLGEVDQAIGATKIHEYAKVADRGDSPLADFALDELFEQTVLLLCTPFLQRRALGKDDAVSTTVDLDHFQPQMPSHLRGERVCAVGPGLGAHHLRHGYEGVDAFHIRQQAALVEPRDLCLEYLAALKSFLEDAPALLPARAVDGE